MRAAGKSLSPTTSFVGGAQRNFRATANKREAAMCRDPTGRKRGCNYADRQNVPTEQGLKPNKTRRFTLGTVPADCGKL